MAPIHIPEKGLVLQRVPRSLSTDTIDSAETQPQVMRLDLASGVLEEIIRASKVGKDIHMSFGKNVTLHYGNRSQQLLSIAQPTQSELYNYTADQEDELRFAGLLTHKLAQKRAQEKTAGVDAAMEALKSKMADHQQNKQNKKIKVLSETPTASPRIKTNHVKPKPNTFFAELSKKKTAIVRSVPSSPAANPARSLVRHPNPATTIRQDTDTREKMEALKFPLLHLVAIRPMSLKFLANKVACSQEECQQVLEKLGKPARLDPDKWDLTDKAFKELSVWDFKYELDDDRELAIEHAVSAFDRMRLSREDRLWQMLLPKEERGKGKILSKLQLHQGPIQKSSTPRIHVQGTVDEQVTDDPALIEGKEKHHLTPDAAAPMARSQSSDQLKKKRVSEQEAQSKRLLSSGPKKAAAAVKVKDMAKRRVTKKESSLQSSKKSSEFVHDSDEEEDEVIAAPAISTARPAVKSKASDASLKTAVDKKPQDAVADPAKGLQEVEKIKNVPKPSNNTSAQTFNSSNKTQSTSGTPASKHRLSDVSQTSSSGSKLARQRTTSSPHKPSPLGSSPPTNASDFDNDSQPQFTSTSSTSSTPLNTHARGAVSGLKPRPDASKRLPNPAEKAPQPSLKRKADDDTRGSHVNNPPLMMNGNIAPAAKRMKTSVPTPPATDTSSSESSPISNTVLDQAKRFKELYERYQRLYQEVSSQANPAPEKVEKVMKIHERLQSMKDDISRAVN
ncbi:MAG: hypothetical protein Q9209_004826 [Squamulea sp. 1 TL-2023]